MYVLPCTRVLEPITFSRVHTSILLDTCFFRAFFFSFFFFFFSVFLLLVFCCFLSGLKPELSRLLLFLECLTSQQHAVCIIRTDLPDISAAMLCISHGRLCPDISAACYVYLTDGSAQTSQQHAMYVSRTDLPDISAACYVYLTDGSAQTSLRAATLIQKSADQTGCLTRHVILTPDEPVLAPTLQWQAPGGVATGWGGRFNPHLLFQCGSTSTCLVQ